MFGLGGGRFATFSAGPQASMWRLSVSERLKDSRWALVRVLLGFAQMFGATAGGVLLLLTGLSLASIFALIGTSACTGASLLLFRRRKG